MVITFGIFLSQILCEDIVACTCQSIAAHAAIVLVLIGGLTGGAKSYDDIAGANVGIVDDILAFHSARDGRVDDDGTYQITDICSFTARGPDADTHAAQFSKQFISAVDNSTDDLAGNQHLIAADGAGHKDVVNSSHTEQVIGVHDDSVLRNSLPNAQITRLLPIEIGQRRLCAGAVSMHDIAVFRIATEDVGDDLAESLGEDTLVDVLDSVVHIFLGGTDASHHVSIIHFFNRKS